MSKTKKQLTILIIILCVCVIGVAAFFLSSSAREKKQAQAQDADTLYLGNLTDLTSVSFSGPEGHAYACTYDSQAGLWRLDGDPDFQVDAEVMDKISKKLVGLTAYRKLDMTEDLSIYGLAQPMATLSAGDSQGNTLKLSFGNLNNGKYYALAEGYEGIYTIGMTVFEAVNLPLTGIMALETVPPADEAHLVSFNIRTNSGADVTFLKETFVTVNDKGENEETYSWHRLDENGQQRVTEDLDYYSTFDTVLFYLKNQSFKSCEVYKYTDDDLETYGLDAPFLTLNVNFVDDSGSDKSLSLYFGNFEDVGEDTMCYFATMEGSKNIYRMSVSFAKNYYLLATGSVPEELAGQTDSGVEIPFQEPDLK